MNVTDHVLAFLLRVHHLRNQNSSILGALKLLDSLVLVLHQVKHLFSTKFFIELRFQNSRSAAASQDAAVILRDASEKLISLAIVILVRSDIDSPIASKQS